MAPIPPDPDAGHEVDDLHLDVTATPVPAEPAPLAVDPEPHGMAAHILERSAEQLHARYPEIGDLDLVRTVLRDSYASLARTSRHPEMLTASAVNYATSRLRSMGIRQGSIEASDPRVLFVCHGNAGRSQMAAALLENRSGGSVTARSAGTSPAGSVLPMALDAMSEIGIPLHHSFPKGVDPDIVGASELVVLFDGAEDFPVPDGVEVQHWSVPSIRGMSLEQVRGVRDALDLQVRGLIADFSEDEASAR